MTERAKVADLKDTSTVREDGTIGLTGRPIYGPRVVLEWCIRSILTKRNSMRWATDKGETLYDLENGDFTTTELEQKRAAFERAMREVDFVVGLTSRLTLDANHKATFTARVVVADSGVYTLAVSIDKAGAVLAQLAEVL